MRLDTHFPARCEALKDFDELGLGHGFWGKEDGVSLESVDNDSRARECRQERRQFSKHEVLYATCSIIFETLRVCSSEFMQHLSPMTLMRSMYISSTRRYPLGTSAAIKKYPFDRWSSANRQLAEPTTDLEACIQTMANAGGKRTYHA